MGVVTRDGETPNDGMGILVSLFSSEKTYQQSLTNEREQDDSNSRPF
jgi:hypothetical protein